MKIFARLVSLVLVCLLIVTACKKSLPAAGGSTLNKTVWSTVGNSSTVQVDSFVYDNQNRLIEFIASGNGSDSVSFQYNASGQLASWIESPSSLGPLVRYDLAYNNNGQVVKATAIALQPNYGFSDYSYAYNAEGELIADSVLTENADPAYTGVLSYDSITYDENGNAIADQQYLSASTNHIGPPFAASEAVQFQYDSHVNPYYTFGIPLFAAGFSSFQVLSKHNMVRSVPSGASELPVSYSFSYYSNALPRTQVLVSPRSTPTGTITETTEYFYQ